MDPKSKLRRSFDNIYDRHPYLASIVASWKVQESRLIDTAATDGPNLYWNPEFLETLNISETTDLLLHEAGHIFLGHHLRFEGKPAKEWNVAADLALNDTIMRHFDHTGRIRKEGLFPGEGMFSDLERGKDAEYYYGKIRKPKEEEGDGDGQGQGQGTGKAKGAQGGQGTGKSGRGDLPSSIGEILPHPDADGTEEAKAELEATWEQQVARGLNDAKSCGNLPGWMEELATSLYQKESRVDWKMLLRRFLTKYAPNKYTYLKPSRRHSYRADVVMPARYGRSAAPGALLVDTSGSMSEPEMNAALSEISAILSAYSRCEVTMYQSDTRLIEGAERVFSRWDFPLRVPHTWHGRGGTDLGPAIKAIAKNRKYSWLAILSDMEWNYANVPNPGIATIWLTTRKAHYGEVPFGAVVPVTVE